MAATKKKGKKPKKGRLQGKGRKRAKKAKAEEKDEDSEIKDEEVIECPWYQPSTQNQRLRTFVGTVQRVFD